MSGPTVPYRGSRPRGGGWIYPVVRGAGQIAGALGRRWLNQQFAAPSQYVPRPQMPRGRGRGGRGISVKGRGGANAPRQKQAAQPSSSDGMGTQTIRVKDSEVFPFEENTFGVCIFTPGDTKLVRLDKFGQMYSQYKIHSVSIAWCSEASTTTEGIVTFGVMPGYQVSSIKNADTIRTLRPFKSGPVWKSESLTVGASLMQQPWMYCQDTKTRDGPAFCLYYIATKKAGYFKITYDVTLRYPHA